MRTKSELNLNQQLGRYSLWLGISALLCTFFVFPRGMYYGFICGAAAMSCAILAKREKRVKGSTPGLLMGIFAILVNTMVFFSFCSFFESVRDPETGPQITRLMLRLMEQYGMTPEQFISVFEF